MPGLGAALVGAALLACAAQAADDGTGGEGVAAARLVVLGGEVFFVAESEARQTALRMLEFQ